MMQNEVNMSAEQQYEAIWAEFSRGGSIAPLLENQGYTQIHGGLKYLLRKYGAAYVKALLINGIFDNFFDSLVEVFWLTTAFEYAAFAVTFLDGCTAAEKAEVHFKYSRLISVYVSNVYSAEFLRSGDLKKIPRLHRFGRCMHAAFELLDGGDTAGYLRQLRGILSECGFAKDIVASLSGLAR